MISCVLYSELRLTGATKPTDDEDFSAAPLGRSRLEFLLDLVELFVTSYELLSDRNAL